jgi:hypothetical protein
VRDEAEGAGGAIQNLKSKIGSASNEISAAARMAPRWSKEFLQSFIINLQLSRFDELLVNLWGKFASNMN